MSERESAALVAPKKCDGCDRPPLLSPPFCCLPCQVTSQVGVNNGHSVTCERHAQGESRV